MVANAIRGMVLTEESYEGDLPDVGDAIIYNGRKHVVLNKTGHYEIERDEWQVDVKLAPTYDCEIRESDVSKTPEWVKDAVGVGN